MIDPMRSFVERFPEARVVISELRDTSSAFDSLCEEYVIINEKLDALAQLAGSDEPARARALRQRRIAIEEELLTLIEGYQPA